LRDDVIFFVYIYQRWAYKVDYTRVNEFGQGGDDEAEVEGEKKDGAKKEGAKEGAKSLPAGPAENTAKATGADAPKVTKRK
jgi:hypothetical protein